MGYCHSVNMSRKMWNLIQVFLLCSLMFNDHVLRFKIIFSKVIEYVNIRWMLKGIYVIESYPNGNGCHSKYWKAISTFFSQKSFFGIIFRIPLLQESKDHFWHVVIFTRFFFELWIPFNWNLTFHLHWWHWNENVWVNFLLMIAKFWKWIHVT